MLLKRTMCCTLDKYPKKKNWKNSHLITFNFFFKKTINIKTLNQHFVLHTSQQLFAATTDIKLTNKLTNHKKFKHVTKTVTCGRTGWGINFFYFLYLIIKLI